jgi:hypothetical protein
MFDRVYYTAEQDDDDTTGKPFTIYRYAGPTDAGTMPTRYADLDAALRKAAALNKAEARREQVYFLVLDVKDYAQQNYEKGGWDVIVECWDDETIAETIGRATTRKGAIAKFKDVVSVYADRQADAVNSAF